MNNKTESMREAMLVAFFAPLREEHLAELRAMKPGQSLCGSAPTLATYFLDLGLRAGKEPLPGRPWPRNKRPAKGQSAKAKGGSTRAAGKPRLSWKD